MRMAFQRCLFAHAGLCSCVQDLEGARVVPYAASSSGGISGTVLLAVILSVVVVFAVACVLAWRHTRHRLSFDAWGLPVRHLVCPPSPPPPLPATVPLAMPTFHTLCRLLRCGVLAAADRVKPADASPVNVAHVAVCLVQRSHDLAARRPGTMLVSAVHQFVV